MNSLKIIGAGEAGTRAALYLRETGWDGEVTLIARNPIFPMNARLSPRLS